MSIREQLNELNTLGRLADPDKMKSSVSRSQLASSGTGIAQANKDRAAANTAKEMAASAEARRQLKLAAVGPDTGGGQIPGGLDAVKSVGSNPWVYGSAAAAAGIGAVMLAKKLRAKKKAAAAKKAKA
jgi:hypothetical protein